MTGIDFATQLASVAHEIALLNTDTEDNPEYYRGQTELAAAMLPGDSEQLRELLDLFVPLIRATENVPF